MKNEFIKRFKKCLDNVRQQRTPFEILMISGRFETIKEPCSLINEWLGTIFQIVTIFERFEKKIKERFVLIKERFGTLFDRFDMIGEQFAMIGEQFTNPATMICWWSSKPYPTAASLLPLWLPASICVDEDATSRYPPALGLVSCGSADIAWAGAEVVACPVGVTCISPVGKACTTVGTVDTCTNWTCGEPIVRGWWLLGLATLTMTGPWDGMPGLTTVYPAGTWPMENTISQNTVLSYFIHQFL